jgi:hypothetical protein
VAKSHLEAALLTHGPIPASIRRRMPHAAAEGEKEQAEEGMQV